MCLAKLNGAAFPCRRKLIMPVQDFLAFVAGAIAVLTLLGLVYRMFLKKIVSEVRDWATWLKKFQRDWDGEPASAGRDATPGYGTAE
jgi:hypothetical protein